MNEIEIKLPVTEEQAASILAIQGIVVTRVETVDQYYDTNGRGTLRIRSETSESPNPFYDPNDRRYEENRETFSSGQKPTYTGISTVITCKGHKTIDPVTGATSRKELELDLRGDFDEWDELLKMLGYQPLMPVTKVRHSFGYFGATVCVDDVEGLGNYVEIEVVAEEGDDASAAAMSRINDTLISLGLENIRPETRGYLDMVLEKQ